MTWMWGNGRTAGVLPMGEVLCYVAGVTKEPTTARYTQDHLEPIFRDRFKGFGDVLALGSFPDRWIYTVMDEVKPPTPRFKGRVVVLGDAAHASCPFWA